MDWERLLEVTLPALLTLGGVYLGSWMTNRQVRETRKAEADEREKEREERRRESRTELSLELARIHAQTIQTTIDHTIRSRNFIDNLSQRKRAGRLSQEEFILELQPKLAEGGELTELENLQSTSYKAAFTLGGHLATEYEKFQKLWSEYVGSVLLLPNPQTEFEAYRQLLVEAGKLQTMVDRKLVEIRAGE